MPHPKRWNKTHGGIVVARGKTICVSCHLKKDPRFCIRFHGLQTPHPSGWLATHPSTAGPSPGLCSKCHTGSFCVGCRGVSLPHSGSFIADHPNQVYGNGGVCVKSHGNGGAGANGCYGGACHDGAI